MLHQTELMPQGNAAHVSTYYRKAFMTYQQQQRVSAQLIAGGYQHIRIEEVKGGYTEIHATRPRETR